MAVAFSDNPATLRAPTLRRPGADGGGHRTRPPAFLGGARTRHGHPGRGSRMTETPRALMEELAPSALRQHYEGAEIRTSRPVAYFRRSCQRQRFSMTS